MKRKLNKKKITILIIAVLIIISTIVFTILYRKNIHVRNFFDEYIFRKNITENTLPNIYNDNYSVYCFNDTIVTLDKNLLTFYNKSAEKASSLDIEISNPIFKANGKYLCIAEKNGSKIYLIHDKDILWQKNIDGKISNLTLNENGYIALSISDTTYTTICKLYSNEGNELFTTYLSTSYIMDSAISDDNKFLALAEANFSKVATQSNIKIISIDNAVSNSANSVVYNHSAPSDSLIVNIDYCSNDNLVCIYDSHIDIIKNNSAEKISNIETSNSLFADINDKLIQIIKVDSGVFSNNFELQIISSSTLEKTIYNLDKEPKSIDVFGNIIAINLGTEVLFINNNAWLIKHYTASQEIHSVILSNNLAGIVFKDKIEFLSL